MHVSVMFMPPLNASYFFLSPLPTNCEGSVPCFQIPRLGSENTIFVFFLHFQFSYLKVHLSFDCRNT